MGKSQKKKSMHRHNPMRVPDSHLPKGLESASATSSKKDVVLPIIQKMESADVSERKWACVAVSNVIQNDPSTRRLLQGKNVVGALITRLSDSEDEVIVESAGALRNLCIDGGHEICGEMYNKNILSPLQVLIPKISQTLSQFLESSKDAPENSKDLLHALTDNVITIVWCLSETSNKALDAVNKMYLAPFLMSFVAARGRLLTTTVVSAAQCLYVLTDDNQVFTNDIRNNSEYTNCLVQTAHSETPVLLDQTADLLEVRKATLRILAVGILKNISPLPQGSPVESSNLDKAIVLPILKPVISTVSLSQCSDAVQTIIDQEPAESGQDGIASKKDLKTDHKSPTELELERIESRLRALSLALEVLTGACATLPDPDFGTSQDEDEDEMDDELPKDDGEGGMAVDDMVTNEPAPVKDTFLTTLVEPLLALIQLTPLSFPPLGRPSPKPPITSALSAIHNCALQCLNNVFFSIGASPPTAIRNDQAAGTTIWNDVWAALGRLGTETGPGQEARAEMWGLAVGVLWGVGIVWKGSLEPKEEQIKLLIQLFQSTEDHQLRVKCVGALECMAQSPSSVAMNKSIAEFLLSLLPPTSDASVVGAEPLIQAVSAIIDIYSDEEMPYDVNFREGRYLERLSSSIDGVKKTVKAIDRKKEGGRELRRRGEEVRENLVAFVGYRRSLRL